MEKMEQPMGNSPFYGIGSLSKAAVKVSNLKGASGLISQQ